MRLTLALLGVLHVLPTPGVHRGRHLEENIWGNASPRATGRKLIMSRLTSPMESQAHLGPVSGCQQDTIASVRKLMLVNSTSSLSEGPSLLPTSTSTTSCAESVNGVSVTSRVVINGTRFGACYSNNTLQANGYPAYFTSREDNGLAVRSDEGLVVVVISLFNETSAYWTLSRYIPGELEIDRIICFNYIDPSSAETPTSSLLDGEWMCDVDGDGGYSLTDDIEVDCGCSAGVDAEEYYACREYESLALNSSGGFMINGTSLDGCYKIYNNIVNPGYPPYFTGPPEDGVPLMFVNTYLSAATGESVMFWSVGILNGSTPYAACFLDVEVLNTSADTTTPLSDGNWFCDFDSDGTYDLYSGTVEVQCACIDDSYTTCYENAEGMSLDSGIVFDGDSIAGCYLPTGSAQNRAQIFSVSGDRSIVGSLVMSLVTHVSTLYNFTDHVWGISRVKEYDEDKDVTTLETICLTQVVNVELPTDPLLRGRWLCTDASGAYFESSESDFDEVTCGCRGDLSSSIPTPTLDVTFPPSSISYSTRSSEATAPPENSGPSPTRRPADGNPVSTNDTPEEQTKQYTPVGIIVGSSIGGAILIGCLVTIFLCVKSRSRRSVHDSCSSLAGGIIGGGHVGQTRSTSATSTLQDLSIPPVNPGRPVAPDGSKDGSNGRSSPPSYVDIVKP